jgi:hypothetical protein
LLAVFALVPRAPDFVELPPRGSSPSRAGE